ncbi:hypothetical protein [Paenibacillus glacialis]|uniref:Essential protein Yae1 N-terminal domain-containing protein n=1 Tax=Paenibacillus glacialis TaxID=494026 RepID=A0A168PFR5_9BACL|nr:hypothetical protein [Paenibacillus glacialis]OAB46716.1 hypothetical protein PGLA_00375 [Paenibacillus glacialis]
MRMIKKKVQSRSKRTYAPCKVSTRALKLKKYKAWNARYYRVFGSTRRKQQTLLSKKKRHAPTPKIAAIPVVPVQTTTTEIGKGLSNSKSYDEAYNKGFNTGFAQGFAQGFEDGNQLGYKSQ